MRVKIDDQTKQIVVLLLAMLGIIAYIISIRMTYDVFQNTRLTDPLVTIHSLHPTYYVAIALMAVAIFMIVIYGIRSKGIQIFLLIAFATMLWFTPYYLAGFVYQPDGPWHVGVALKMPQVLSGDEPSHYWYNLNYPNSYIFHYTFINLLGMEPLLYISNIFPFLRLCLFVLLCYLFFSNLFGSRIAFFASALMIPGLHYTQLHPSPASIGIILVFTVLILFMKSGTPNKVLTILLIVSVVAVHPVSPLLLLVFLGAAFVTGFLKKPCKHQILLAAMIIICFAGWFFWIALLPPPPGDTTQTTVVDTVSAGKVIDSVASLELNTTKEFLLGTRFLYSNIYHLNRAIYFGYLLLTATLLLYIVITNYLSQRNFKNWLLRLGGLSHSQIFFIITLPLLLILIILLAENSPDLMERALTPIILVLSCLIASGILILLSKRWMKFAVLSLLIFLTISFPVVAYSIDAYNSFPLSEKAGLEFLSEEHLDENKLIIGKSVQQVHLYRENMRHEGGRINKRKIELADIVVLRNTEYYYTSLRRDLSYDNYFSRLREQLKTDTSYNKNYQSPSFEIYGKIK
jgi:hypothetical protein